MSNGAIVYQGPSLLTGAPVFVALTGLTHPSQNEKTGPMVQAWILHAEQKPTEAVKSGSDDAICGSCRHRSGSNIGRSCYVIWWMGPERVYLAKDNYPITMPLLLGRQLRDKHVRFGAYGDPAAVPAHIWFELAKVSAGHTGYTHHWRTCSPFLARILMASVDTLEEKREAEALGWRTFRVRPFDGPLETNEVVCPASHEAGYRATCDECRLCGGSAREAKSVAILPHGQRIKWLTAL